jgi:hypothetical protein
MEPACRSAFRVISWSYLATSVWPGVGGKRGTVVVRCRDRYTAGLPTLNRQRSRRRCSRRCRACGSRTAARPHRGRLAGRGYRAAALAERGASRRFAWLGPPVAERLAGGVIQPCALAVILAQPGTVAQQAGHAAGREDEPYKHPIGHRT